MIPEHKTQPILLSLGLTDPNKVWMIDGEVWRNVIPRCQREQGRWAGLLEFCQSDLFRELQERQFILPHFSDPTKCWLRTERIRPFTGPICWTRMMIRDAMIHSIVMNRFLLDHPNNERKFCASDAHIWNIGFHRSQPYYLDIGSFSPGAQPECRINDFFTDLKVSPLDLGDAGTVLYPLDKAQACLESMDICEAKTEWDDYPQPEAVKDSSSKEAALFFSWYHMVKPDRITDVGSNAGRLSLLLESLGAEMTAIDISATSLNRLYQKSRSDRLKINPVLLDVANLRAREGFREPDCWSAGRTWQDCRSPVCLASSVVHHLSKRLNFDEQASIWDDLSDRHLWIEWIDPTDVHLRTWTLPSWYMRSSWLESLCSQGWKLIKHVSDVEVSTRDWYWFEK